MYKRLGFIGLTALALVIMAILLMPSSAQRDGIAYWKAEVIAEQIDQGTRSVKLLSGPQRGQTVDASIGAMLRSIEISAPSYETGSKVFVSHNTTTEGTDNYIIIDYYRISSAVWLFLAIFAVAVLFAGWRGFGALVGLIFSTVVITQFLIPNIIDGRAPYLITAVAIMVISLPGIYIAHGINRRTHLALISTYMTLAVAVVLSIIAVKATALSGVSSEDVWFLSQVEPGLNIRGLLLCGMLISLVGILDDVTVNQANVVHEIKAANPKLSTTELYQRGLRVGREHIASLINTLVLVYVGASFLFIVYITVVVAAPPLIVLNSEFIMEEIVRSLVGSGALILAVPITTILAAYFSRLPVKKAVSRPRKKT